ncbi:damage-control phosphatase ARMT1-like isoform X3 [Paramacrobiotus metropolitanus]|uniref:damage-control phosphatase ARMT1-like isoform X3 n=1 Tax=Paramacrobiotus metropolitanus TaxID=2943436 RepID=UPI00244591E9|nr:damage-control phosphatase ARMT1-like isoform X3 [Paramacrobiotus metropolitanus]
MDQTDEIWDYISKLPTTSSQPLRIDIVCDNAGLELNTDLVFGTVLLETKLAGVIHYHVMQLPCYVSDATISDFYHAIQLAKQHNPQISAKWEEYLHNGQFIVKSDGFWSLPWDFDHMAQRAPELYRDLGTASLIIFKGDLNYRKLDGDLQWPPATPMQRGVQGFAPAAWCVLRALKGDTVVGLPKGRAEEMQAQDDNWMTSGNFAVVQFFRQKPA